MQGSSDRRCDIYANIKEEASGARVTVCSGDTRYRHLYTTVSSSVEIQIVNTGDNGDRSSYFAIAFQGMLCSLTHWGRVTHKCVSKLTIIGSDNGLSPGRRQAIIWTNAGLLSIGPLGTNFSEILIEIYKFSFKKIHLKVSSGNSRPSCLGLNVLIRQINICIEDKSAVF